MALPGIGDQYMLERLVSGGTIGVAHHGRVPDEYMIVDYVLPGSAIEALDKMVEETGRRPR